ncbi:uncharacterized protein LOC111637938 [Centruroides sculpturatus]|uniref:uncharacterized protein LOC111637938 n=1 Tax=Centruroides sculpturatus TaxID=218467 RepID=UPI000C6D2851|nr:uncharacterized protein LOC111637938 [Centruroides sculpturatus]
MTSDQQQFKSVDDRYYRYQTLYIHLDFERYVIDVLYAIENKTGTNVSWFNFYNPELHKNDPEFSLADLEPDGEKKSIKVPFFTTVEITNITDHLNVEVWVGRTDYIHNDGDRRRSYSIKASIFQPAIDDIIEEKSLWWSIFFPSSYSSLKDVLSEWNKFNARRPTFNIIDDMITGSYKTELDPSETLKLQWNIITKTKIIDYKISVYLMGSLVVALQNGDDVYPIEIPLTNLANDDFEAVKVPGLQGLRYIAEGYVKHKYGLFAIPDVDRLSNKVNTKFSTGTLKVQDIIYPY